MEEDTACIGIDGVLRRSTVQCFKPAGIGLHARRLGVLGHLCMFFYFPFLGWDCSIKISLLSILQPAISRTPTFYLFQIC